ncbi:MAG: hypothetical protein Q7U02_08455 [Desulfosalsimonadaceae bacterium]|nr:hypothetical protein [Desulfosalsimonadaceae bacterium]
MEIIFELIFSMIGFIFEAFFEVFAQAIFEVAAEIGLRSLAEPFRRPKPINPILAGIGYLLYGAIAGGLSLLLPRMFLAPWWLRVLNLAITPIACGFIMAKVGQMRDLRGQQVLRIDKFLYGYLFALAMAVVRFIWR